MVIVFKINVCKISSSFTVVYGQAGNTLLLIYILSLPRWWLSPEVSVITVLNIPCCDAFQKKGACFSQMPLGRPNSNAMSSAFCMGFRIEIGLQCKVKFKVWWQKEVLGLQHRLGIGDWPSVYSGAHLDTQCVTSVASITIINQSEQF